MAFDSIRPLPRVLRLANRCLDGVVEIDSYEYASCYLWYDRPLFDPFGDPIRVLRGDRIYLFESAPNPEQDLFHELGHLVARRHDLIGHSENGFRGSWERHNARLIAEVEERRHWSRYLNLFASSQPDFGHKAASEVFAELFMLWHLRPRWAEARLLDEVMDSLQGDSASSAIADLALEFRILDDE